MSSFEARVAALEYVVALAMSQLWTAAEFSPEAAGELQRQVRARMSERSLATYSDPALSDVRSAEIVESIDRLFDAAIALLRTAPR